MPVQNRKYGWKPDLPDIRDRGFGLLLPPHKLPPVVDMRAKCCPVYDQGQLGSCVSNAVAAAIRFELKRQSAADFEPSRLMLYYDGRVIEGTINDDAGLTVRDGISVAVNQGACSESEWPYDPNAFATQPTPACYADGLKHEARAYFRLDNRNLPMLKTCLALGLAFVFGFSVYDSFESDTVAATGVVPMPALTENLLGGHCTMAVGYDDPSQRFTVMNSWGSQWGQSGFFTIPYSYLTDTNLADDFWSIWIMES